MRQCQQNSQYAPIVLCSKPLTIFNTTCARYNTRTTSTDIHTYPLVPNNHVLLELLCLLSLNNLEVVKSILLKSLSLNVEDVRNEVVVVLLRLGDVVTSGKLVRQRELSGSDESVDSVVRLGGRESSESELHVGGFLNDQIVHPGVSICSRTS